MAAISEKNDMNVQVYPNPAQDFLNLSADGTIDQVEIFNADGSIVQQVNANDMNMQLPIHTLTDGVYFLSIRLNGSNTYYRFIKN